MTAPTPAGPPRSGPQFAPLARVRKAFEAAFAGLAEAFRPLDALTPEQLERRRRRLYDLRVARERHEGQRFVREEAERLRRNLGLRADTDPRRAER